MSVIAYIMIIIGAGTLASGFMKLTEVLDK